jgi:hypothetical protein
LGALPSPDYCGPDDSGSEPAAAALELIEAGKRDLPAHGDGDSGDTESIACAALKLDIPTRAIAPVRW